MFDVNSSHILPKDVRKGSVVRIKNPKTRSNSFFDGWYLVRVIDNIEKSDEVTVFSYEMIEPPFHPVKKRKAQQFAYWNKEKGRWDDSDPSWEVV